MKDNYVKIESEDVDKVAGRYGNLNDAAQTSGITSAGMSLFLIIFSAIRMFKGESAYSYLLWAIFFMAMLAGSIVAIYETQKRKDWNELKTELWTVANSILAKIKTSKSEETMFQYVDKLNDMAQVLAYSGIYFITCDWFYGKGPGFDWSKICIYNLLNLNVNKRFAKSMASYRWVVNDKVTLYNTSLNIVDEE